MRVSVGDDLRVWWVVATGFFVSGWSHLYTSWQLPPQVPQFGTFGLVLAGDVFPLLIVPLLVIRLLRPEPLEAYGWRLPPLRQLGVVSGLAFLALLPLVVVLSMRPELQAAYPSPAFPPAREGGVGLAVLWLLHHAPQLFALEFCFRGFLTLPLARAAGIGGALVAVVPWYVLLHVDKPGLELALAAWGGVVFGVAAWRTGSFLPAFLAHWAVAATMDALCLFWAGRP